MRADLKRRYIAIPRFQRISGSARNLFEPAPGVAFCASLARSRRLKNSIFLMSGRAW